MTHAAGDGSSAAGLTSETPHRLANYMYFTAVEAYMCVYSIDTWKQLHVVVTVQSCTLEVTSVLVGKTLPCRHAAKLKDVASTEVQLLIHIDVILYALTLFLLVQNPDR